MWEVSKQIQPFSLSVNHYIHYPDLLNLAVIKQVCCRFREGFLGAEEESVPKRRGKCKLLAFTCLCFQQTTIYF